MKICLAALLAAFLTMAPLSGCGKLSPLDPENPTVLELWHYYNGPQKAVFDKLVEEFNLTDGLEKGIVVEGHSRGDVNELTQKILAAANKEVGAGSIPHIFAAYADTAYQVDRLGLLADMKDYFSEKELSEYIPEYLDEGRFDGGESLKLFPVAKSTELMFLNRTDWEPFAAATGAELTALETIEGVTRTAENYYRWTDSLTPEPGDGKAFFGRDALANYLIVGCRQLGVEIFQIKGDRAEFCLDEAALRRIWDNYFIPSIYGWFAAEGRFRSDDAKTGVIISFVGSSSGASYYPTQVNNGEESYPIEVVILPPPRFEGGELAAVQQGAGMAVTKSGQAREYAAAEFLKWFTQAQRNFSFAAGSGYMPVKREAYYLDGFGRMAGDDIPDMNPFTRIALETAIRMTARDGYTYYTPKPFKGATKARGVLNQSLTSYVEQARQEVETAMAGGTTREQAAASLDSGKWFRRWLEDLRGQLESAVE